MQHTQSRLKTTRRALSARHIAYLFSRHNFTLCSFYLKSPTVHLQLLSDTLDCTWKIILAEKLFDANHTHLRGRKSLKGKYFWGFLSEPSLARAGISGLPIVLLGLAPRCSLEDSSL